VDRELIKIRAERVRTHKFEKVRKVRCNTTSFFEWEADVVAVGAKEDV